MCNDIIDWISHCDIFHENKGSTQAPFEVLKYPTPNIPWERVSVVTLGPMAVTHDGDRYVLTH